MLMVAAAVLMGFAIYAAAQVHAADTDTLCIELDPGHGGEQTGAEAVEGITMEKDINLSMALALKEELENYENIEVHLTRTEDEELELEQRTKKALKDGADFMISIHNNAKGPVAPYDNGSTVLAANGNYRAALAKEEYKLGVNILRELEETGLENQGLMLRDSQAGETYGNGKTADYYGLVRAGILEKIPTIIIEHAFVDNSSEFEEFLSTDEKIRELARADARGIARFFQLRNKNSGDTLPALTDIYEKIVYVIDENGNHNTERMEYFNRTVWAKIPDSRLSENSGTVQDSSIVENGGIAEESGGTENGGVAEESGGTENGSIAESSGAAENERKTEAANKDKAKNRRKNRYMLPITAGVLLMLAVLIMFALGKRRRESRGKQ